LSIKYQWDQALLDLVEPNFLPKNKKPDCFSWFTRHIMANESIFNTI